MQTSVKDIDVLLLSAGYGKRLGELTKNTPKPLVEIAGKKLIEWNLELLSREGFQRVFVNVFYLKEQLIEFLGDGSRWNLEIIVVEESVLLDTGGAIKNIEKQLHGNALVTVNSDVMVGPEFSFSMLLNAHTGFVKHGALATLVLRNDADANAFGELGIDGQGRVCSFLGRDYISGTTVRSLMYTGIQVISRTLITQMPSAGSVFSITKDTYSKVLERQGFIGSAIYQGFWSDLGTPESMEQASNKIRDIFSIP